MNRLPQMLCLMALAGATAFSQTSAPATQASDPSLASARKPALTQPGDDPSNDAQAQATLRDDTQANTVSGTAAKPSAAKRELQPGSAPLEADAIAPSAVNQPQLQPRTNRAESVLPVATVLRLKLVRPISTATARPGEKFFATLSSPVVVEGQTIIPSGTSVTCRVDGAHAGRRFAGKPSISIRAVSVQLPSGEVLEFTASVIDTATPRKLDVDQEGRVRGATFSPMDKIETGSLAGAGLIAGAVIAGPEGLFIGAASGAALAAGHILVKHKDLTLPAGTELIFELDAPATTAHSQTDAAM